MASIMESDIDQFIQNQKAKLQQERQSLADDERGERVGRRQWDDPGRETQYAEQNTKDSPCKPEVDYKEWERSFQKGKQRDYNDYLEQQKHRSRKQATPPGSGMKFGEFEEYRKKIDRQRKQEYKEDLEKQQDEQMLLKARRDYNNIPFIQTSPRLDPYKEKLDHEISDKIMSQKFKEFDKMMAINKKHDKRRWENERVQAESQVRAQEWKDFDESLPQYPPEQQTQPHIERPSEPNNYRNTYSYQKHQEKLKDEREKETRTFLEQRQEREREVYREQLPPKPPTPGGMFNKLGAHDRQREKLNEERKEEYNKLINEGDRRGRNRGHDSQREPQQETYQPEVRPRPSTDEGPSASLKGLNPRDSAEIRKKQLRNDEYNEFLRQKGGKTRGRQTEGRPPLPSSAKNPRESQKKEDIFATLPGLHYSDSADKRKMAERNREYNEMLQKKGGNRRGRSDEPPGPRRGWQSPSYDEILDRKRQEESQYRREDPSYSGMRAYNSEPAIDTLGNDRYKELDREYETRKVRFRDQRANILEDDQWLNADQARRDAEYRELQQPPPAPRGPTKEEPSQPEMATSYFATLPVGTDRGGNERDSAKRRKQNKYREELQLQMQETLAAKRREKVEDLRVNATGLLDPEKTSHRLVNLGNPEITPRRNMRSPEVQAYHTKFDLSPRGGRRGQELSLDLGGGGGGGGYPTERGRSLQRGRRAGGGGGGGGGGLLDTGFEGLLESRPRGGGYVPPGIQYQPSTYITGGGGGGLGNPALSSIDEAYHFYGMRNPLEPEGSGGGGGLDIPLNRLDDAGFRDRMSPPRVTFEENTRNRSRSRERISPYQFPSDDDFRSKSRQDQKEYQIELERQIQEKRYRDQKAKEEKDRYERKLEEEIRNYNPFGRGGGGAPIKDTYGNAVTDLRSMHYDNVGGPGSARSPPPRESPRFRAPGSPKDDLIKPPPVQQNAKGESTYARGGHGIFGQPRTDAEKTTADKYKDDLRRQIEDKKRQEQIEREKEKIEEEKENRRLEEQRIRIQQEYEEEVRKKREKEEDARRKNEELRSQAEERKKEEQRKKMEQADAKSKERQEQQERERTERQRDDRGGSPPIPAVRSKMATENGEPSTSDGRGNSPPVPSLRTKQDEAPQNPPAPTPLARANSSDVLKELATMRKQLQSERKRVENALENQKNEPDVFDPRMVQRPPPREIDVFERAKQGHAAVPQRTSDTANARTLQEFNELKYKTDSDSRRAFRSMFPDAPTSNSALESQQDALLRHQEDTLKNLKDRNYGPGRQTTLSPKSMLNSNSAFIDVDGLNHFPEDFEDLPKRNESARLRRRERFPVSPRPESFNLNPNLNPMGSQTSLDVDRIQKKNDARLRRLHQMNTDDVSVADPDDILDRFMAKQRYNRPPSGQTLQDDSWLRPGSKAF